METKNLFYVRKEIYKKDGYNLIKELYRTKSYIYMMKQKKMDIILKYI